MSKLVQDQNLSIIERVDLEDVYRIYQKKGNYCHSRKGEMKYI